MLLLAHAYAEGRLDDRRIDGLDDAAAIAAIVAVRGLGPWTAEVYLLFALERMDVFPAGDIALAGAHADLHGLAARLALPPGRRPHAGRPTARWPPACSGTTGATSPAALPWTTFRHPDPAETGTIDSSFSITLPRHHPRHPGLSDTVHHPGETRPQAQDHLPTTFLERGIAVPFTTPQLAGARVRPGTRGGLELLVPNPSGGRGIYILPWDGMGALCRPTVHDSRLSAAVGALRVMTPAAIRQAARQAASQGYAGRRAAAAAAAALKAERQSSLLANFALLLQLVRKVEQPGENAVPPEQERPAGVELRARRAIARIAPQLARSPEAVAGALEELSVLYSGIGVPGDRTGARIPILLARLCRMRAALDPYVASANEECALQADLAAHALDLTVACTRAVLEDCHAAIHDIVALLRRWMTESEALATLLARPDWLLDGWDRIVALWEHAGAGSLGEIAMLLPIVPREAAGWVNRHIDISSDMQRHRRKVALFEDWRTGHFLLDLVARNETLIAEVA